MSDPAQSKGHDTGLVVIETSLGWIGVAMKKGRITACTLFRPTRESVLNVLLSLLAGNSRVGRKPGSRPG